LQAKQVHTEIIVLYNKREELKPYPIWYLQSLFSHHISERHLDALIMFHGIDFQTYIDKLFGLNEISENDHKLKDYNCKIFVLSLYYYDNINEDIFKVEETYNPKKKFHIKTETISYHRGTFDCPICLSTINNELCVICSCNHKVCSDCFYDQTKHTNNLKIKKAKCCFCRAYIKNIQFLDEKNRQLFLSNFDICV
jgi:hypothetical protein